MGVDCLDVSGCIRKPLASPFNGLLGRFSGLMLPMVHAYALCDCRLFYAIYGGKPLVIPLGDPSWLGILGQIFL